MLPDFTKKTVDIIAKRAAYKCSNPDCRISTVGPNSDDDKSTVIGEAAHINGARPHSKRYRADMTDNSRAEITNAVWLCRNCHKIIDSDEQNYSTNVVFAWREEHEKYIFSELGNTTDHMQFDEQNKELSLFKNYPPIIRRIVIDKPDGWEFRLTSELMQYFNEPFLRKLRDLQDGLCIKSQSHIDSNDAFKWVQNRLTERSNLISPLAALINR